MFKIYNALKKELKTFKNFSKKYGHWKSVYHNKSIDKNENPIPWYTYPSIEYIEQFDLSGKRVFEWGAGNSTHYWASKVKSLVCVEDSKEWFDKINTELKENVSLIFRTDKKSYVNEIIKHKPFDIIVIDAKYRSECSSMIKKSLSKDGIVIFDNSDRYPKSCKKIRDECDLIQIDFHGFAPINNYSHTTSLFLSRTTRLIPKGVQPNFSFASLKEIRE